MHEHEHDHDHAHHSHPHSHEHTGGKPMSHEEVLALLTYMLDHNRHHTEAAAALAEALHEYDHGNSKLEKALELAKQN